MCTSFKATFKRHSYTSTVVIYEILLLFQKYLSACLFWLSICFLSELLCACYVVIHLLWKMFSVHFSVISLVPCLGIDPWPLKRFWVILNEKLKSFCHHIIGKVLFNLIFNVQFWVDTELNCRMNTKILNTISPLIYCQIDNYHA